jgi:ribonuclease HI
MTHLLEKHVNRYENKYEGARDQRGQNAIEAPQVMKIEAIEEVPKRVINAITGGSSLGVESKRQRKAYVRQVNHVGTSYQSNPPVYSKTVISFGPEDAEGILFPHQDPLVVSVEIAQCEVQRVLIDGGSSADVLFYDAFKKMQIREDRLTNAGVPLQGFGGQQVHAIGKISLQVVFGKGTNVRKEEILFDVVDMPYQYNAILGRSTINIFEAIIHHNYICMKLPGPRGVITVRGEQLAARKYELQGTPSVKGVHVVDQKQGEYIKIQKPIPEGKTKKVQLDEHDPGKFILIGENLEKHVEEEILKVVKENMAVFAWSPDELQGVDRSLIEHNLAIKSGYKPKKQKLRRMSTDRQQAAKIELEKLLKAKVIREVMHPEWLANPVLVKKANGKWRMCIDFTDLNKACPKDDFPLPRIDQLVDATAGCELMSFLDAYSGYHQVFMVKEDEEKTSFITPFGTYCFIRMPFGLKNVGATFARLIGKVLAKQLGRNVEAYVDDIVVKSKQAFTHGKDLQEIFENLRKCSVKLNPEKCVFGVRAGKLLGFLVSKRGIEANPDKIAAIHQMEPPKNTREVQRLTGRMASLSRFLSKSAEKGLPFFKTLRGANTFEWTAECQQAFDDLKKYLHEMPTLASPPKGQPLLMYVAATPATVSAVLVQEEENRQVPVYFVSEALQGPKTRYSEVEKLIYAIVMASRKLRHYFLSHDITIPSAYPIGEVLTNKEVAGRIAKWAMELLPFDLKYILRTAIKSQVLADFVAEWTPNEVEQQEEVEKPWIVFSDGACNAAGAGAAAIVKTPMKQTLKYSVQLAFPSTNNTAEYEGVLLAMRKARALGARRLIVKTDSKLVAGHFSKSFEAKEKTMAKYLEEARLNEKHFLGITVKAITREENGEADELAKAAATGQPLENSFFDIITQPSYEKKEVACIQREGDWREPILKYLVSAQLPEKEEEAKRIQLTSKKYKVVEGQLYKSGVTAPLLKCVTREDGMKMVVEIHEGLCGAHQAPRSVASKVIRQGIYWPTIMKDTEKYIKTCKACQKFGPMTKAPPKELQPIPPVWPFYRWGIDIVGPLPRAKGDLRFVIVAIEYFSRWIEAEAVARITSAAVQKFVWKNIICRFGIPKQIVCDNGKKFESGKFQDMCKGLNLQINFASVGHPQTNGAVERANGKIMEAIKKRLEGSAKGKWPEDLLSVLWALRTTVVRSTGMTPFRLVYGDEAMTPSEVGAHSPRMIFDQKDEEGREITLEMLDEIRVEALEKMASYTEGTKSY